MCSFWWQPASLGLLWLVDASLQALPLASHSLHSRVPASPVIIRTPGRLDEAPTVLQYDLTLTSYLCNDSIIFKCGHSLRFWEPRTHPSTHPTVIFHPHLRTSRCSGPSLQNLPSCINTDRCWVPARLPGAGGGAIEWSPSEPSQQAPSQEKGPLVTDLVCFLFH